jgi:hypothetical protein
LEVKDGYSLLDSQVACPAELQVRRGGFFFSQRSQDAKEGNSALITCLSAGGLCDFASLRAILFFSRKGEETQRKIISLLACLP